MATYIRNNLKTFVNNYYLSEESRLPSIGKIAEDIGISIGQTRTLLNYFCDMNFIYRDETGYSIFQTTKSFEFPEKIYEDNAYIIFESNSYQIKFDKVEFFEQFHLPTITTIEDLISALFWVCVDRHVQKNKTFYMEDNLAWIETIILSKQGKLKLSFKFTQHTKTINLFNKQTNTLKK